MGLAFLRLRRSTGKKESGTTNIYRRARQLKPRLPLTEQPTMPMTPYPTLQISIMPRKRHYSFRTLAFLTRVVFSNQKAGMTILGTENHIRHADDISGAPLLNFH